MARYIDADEAIDRLKYLVKSLALPKWVADFAANVISEVPTVDVVPVVRCKDCKWHKQACTAQYYDGSRRIEHICTLLQIIINNLDSYCADGERKNGGKCDAEIH